jgi:phosphatidylserine synthase
MAFDPTVDERVPLVKMLTLADYFTLWNGVTGFSAIVATAAGLYPLAFSLILIAVLLDGVDGGVARLGYGGGRLGDKLDTLSDLISFCVAPAFLFVSAFRGAEYFPGLPVPGWLQPSVWGFGVLLVAGAAYMIAGMLRLARFDYLKGGARHDYFVGVTTPNGAVILASIAILPINLFPALIILAATSGLMISRLRLPKVRGAMVLPSIVILLSAALLQERFNDLGPIMLLLFTLAYFLFGPVVVRRREEDEMELPTF